MTNCSSRLLKLIDGRVVDCVVDTTLVLIVVFVVVFLLIVLVSVLTVYLLRRYNLLSRLNMRLISVRLTSVNQSINQSIWISLVGAIYVTEE